MAWEEAIALVEPPEPEWPDMAMTSSSHLERVEVAAAPCGVRRVTNSLSEDLRSLVYFRYAFT